MRKEEKMLQTVLWKIYQAKINDRDSFVLLDKNEKIIGERSTIKELIKLINDNLSDKIHKRSMDDSVNVLLVSDVKQYLKKSLKDFDGAFCSTCECEHGRKAKEWCEINEIAEKIFINRFGKKLL